MVFKQSITLFAAISFLVILTACDDYSSKVPLNKHWRSHIDSTYLGRWKFITEDNTDSLATYFEGHELEIMAFNEHEYALKVSGEDKSVSFFRGFISTIENDQYANIQLLELDSREFLIYKFVVSNDTLTYYPINKLLYNDQYKKSKNFRKALVKAYKEKNIFGPPRRYVKIQKKKLF
ncbi:MAG: hypothetical protein CL843_20110 [Crocinitomicaceae bacterium]|nr:hypothetical protein [Crocinitomicaceae bacterium]MAX82470.1 hypothetical protein [Crocinitomicaceae bacterium]